MLHMPLHCSVAAVKHPYHFDSMTVKMHECMNMNICTDCTDTLYRMWIHFYVSLFQIHLFLYFQDTVFEVVFVSRNKYMWTDSYVFLCVLCIPYSGNMQNDPTLLLNKADLSFGLISENKQQQTFILCSIFTLVEWRIQIFPCFPGYQTLSRKFRKL